MTFSPTHGVNRALHHKTMTRTISGSTPASTNQLDSLYYLPLNKQRNSKSPALVLM